MKERGTKGPWAVVAAFAVGVNLLFAFVYLVAGSGWSRSPDSRFTVAAYQPRDLIPDPTAIAPRKGGTVAPVDLAKAFRGSGKAMARGKDLFEKLCVSCHGPEGKGDGPAGLTLDPGPRDFASSEGWTNGATLADLFRTVSKGVPGTGMAAYDYLPAEDRFALAHLVQSLGTFNHGKDSPAAVAKLDAEFSLSKGVHEPNLAPVRTVMENVASAYEPPPAIEIPSRRGEGAALLVESAVWDRRRAASTLAGTPGWRRDLSAFSAAVSSGAPNNGFRVSVGSWKRDRWARLQAALAGSEAEGKGTGPQPER